eukprot:CAMPEP_0204389422 /NCGR_PEP_ID=MMETSP0469-20131031/60095_1 /ASSEMBLY_ACC=CAM_ASM_000384 /TAXON_ID=2969 /ORGANISM="Oxyrrhis marina" /LENGTH=357 /DNA_ID=CAMNT_0051383107 /DNA_START=35 /DNA_END=1108 /DNA_ORIENTATION=-
MSHAEPGEEFASMWHDQAEVKNTFLEVRGPRASLRRVSSDPSISPTNSWECQASDAAALLRAEAKIAAQGAAFPPSSWADEEPDTEEPASHSGIEQQPLPLEAVATGRSWNAAAAGQPAQQRSLIGLSSPRHSDSSSSARGKDSEDPVVRRSSGRCRNRLPPAELQELRRSVAADVLEHLHAEPGGKMNLATLGNRIAARAQLRECGIRFASFLEGLPGIVVEDTGLVRALALAPAKRAPSGMEGRRFRRGQFVEALRDRTLGREFVFELHRLLADVQHLLLAAPGYCDAASSLGNQLSPWSRRFLRRFRIRLNELLQVFPLLFQLTGVVEASPHVSLTRTGQSELITHDQVEQLLL